MNEVEIKLDKFTPKPYQLPLCDALENKGYKKLLAIWPRRAGKDLVAFNLMIREALRKVGNYAYCLPTFKQCRLVIWDSITNHHQRFLDYIPRELIKSINSQELRITLHNGSQIQMIGSDSYDTALVGTNFRFVCLSEYALCDKRVYALVRPILNANGGVLMILSTPRSRNHLYTLYNIAINNPDQWYCSKLTLDDTQHISMDKIQKEIDAGEISKDMVAQEYYTSFDLGASGSFYGKYIDEMTLQGQITDVAWHSEFPVSTAWDIGVRDSTSIIWFQRVGRNIHIIDCYENSKEGLEHYIKIINTKPYMYDKHWAPHDIAVKEFGSGLTRLEKARQLGLKFETRESGTKSGLPHISIEDGIEACRSAFSRIYIDEKRCKELIKALSNYRQEYDEKHDVYKSRPLHDKNCFTGNTLILTRNGMRPIMDVKINDEVLTLQGWKKCLNSWKSKENAKLVEVKFQDGMKVKCTPEHLFLTEIGWKSAESLTQNTKIQSSLMRSQHTFQDLYTKFGQMSDISLGEVEDCIEMFGSLHLVKSQMVVIYIIETIIQKIITLIISNVCLDLNILNILDQMLNLHLKLQEIKLQNGINPLKEEDGIVIKQLGASLGKNELEFQLYVCNVLEILKDWLIKGRIAKNSVIPIVKLPIIESVKYLEKTEDVYDIEVEDVHHFSLSNGAIVHNSHFADAFRYLVLSLSRTKDSQMNAEELERRYLQTIQGQSELPGFFGNDNFRDSSWRY